MTRALLLALAILVAGCSEDEGPSGRIVDLGADGVVLRPIDGGKPETVRLRPEVWSDVDYAPDGKRIAYDSEDGIVVADANGGNARLLRDQPPTAEFLSSGPSWSPDGERIAFEQDETIYTISTAGDRLRTVTRGSLLDWSPKQDRIVFVRDWDPNRTRGEIVVANADGSHARVLARGTWPAISPDGETVAFSTSVGSDDASISVVPLEGGRRRVVARDAFGPVWSPDGRYLAFSRFTTCGHAVCSGRIFVMPVDGGNARPIGPLVGDIGPPLGWIE